MNILYVTYTGITDHIGRSQIAPYLLGLADLGYRITIVSAEKAGRETLTRRYASRFESHGLGWKRVTYRPRPPLLGHAATLVGLYLVARKLAAAARFDLVHCRGHLGAIVGERLKRRFGLKLLFDFREFWPDSRLETAGRLEFAYRALKRRERRLVRAADGVVCLTERAAHLLSSWYLQDQPSPRSRFQVIPCCADFVRFDPSRIPASATERARARAGLAPGDLVLIYLGSLGPDYLLRQMLLAFRRLLAVRPHAKFLFVSNNGRELVERECAALGIALAKICFVSADSDEVPAYVSLADLGVVFIRPALSKAGCSPVKLAELFACNVPVIANAGVGDLDRIISPERNGSVIVDDFEDSTIDAALARVLDQDRVLEGTVRSNSLEFSLETGTKLYTSVYERLGGKA